MLKKRTASRHLFIVNGRSGATRGCPGRLKFFSLASCTSFPENTAAVIGQLSDGVGGVIFRDRQQHHLGRITAGRLAGGANPVANLLQSLIQFHARDLATGQVVRQGRLASAVLALAGRGAARRMPRMARSYWLVKQEPEAYSWDDFVKEGETYWDGVRNYQARNNLRAMKKGDLVFLPQCER